MEARSKRNKTRLFCGNPLSPYIKSILGGHKTTRNKTLQEEIPQSRGMSEQTYEAKKVYVGSKMVCFDKLIFTLCIILVRDEKLIV